MGRKKQTQAKTTHHRVRRWVMTIWDVTPEDRDALEKWYNDNSDKIVYIYCGPIELTETTNRPHSHGVVYFKDVQYKTFFGRSKFMGRDSKNLNAWFDKELNTADYHKYMNKEGGAPFAEFGTLPITPAEAGRAASKKLTEKIREIYTSEGMMGLIEGLTPYEFSHAAKILPIIQMPRKARLKKIQEYVQAQPDSIVADLFTNRHGHARLFNVHFFGPSGRGKSLLARRLGEYIAENLRDILYSPDRELDDIGVYNKMSNGYWFDGFDGHAVLMIDDWRPHSHGTSFSSMMALFDMYNNAVQVKNGSVQMNAVSVFTTSIEPLWGSSWDKMFSDENRTQVYRRVPFAVDISCLELFGNVKKNCRRCKRSKSPCDNCIAEQAPTCLQREQHDLEQWDVRMVALHPDGGGEWRGIPRDKDGEPIVHMLCCMLGPIGDIVRGRYMADVKPNLLFDAKDVILERNSH